jgi:hypothetical protein
MRSLERSGTFQLGDLRVRRLGYGAMHLSGAGVFGPPKDRRSDDGIIDRLADDRIAYVPFFPLGGFAPLQSSTLSQVARLLNATTAQVALPGGCFAARPTCY